MAQVGAPSTTARRWAGVQENGPAASRTTSTNRFEMPRASNPRTYQDRNSSADDLDILNKAFHRVCCINLDARVDKWKLMQRDAEKVGRSFQQRMERVSAVEGKQLMLQGDASIENNEKSASARDCGDNDNTAASLIDDVCFEWDGTTDAKYNRHGRSGMRTMTPSEAGCALSHVMLWRQLASAETANHDVNPAILILEDDARFSKSRGGSRFAKAFVKAYKLLPEDWGIFYLGLSDRGERTWLDTENNAEDDVTTTTDLSDRASNPPVRLYKPEYGYHTHAYAIRKETAAVLVQNLPICGPVDVWLADNQWFSQPVYCAVIQGEGWKLNDGTYEGNDLVIQERRGIANDIEYCS
jgi:GR25 family glycosyltransferase involved in LPS biosynthesis